MGWGGAGRGRAGQFWSKKSKTTLTSPRGMGLESRTILAPPPLRGGENPRGVKQGGTGQNCIPSLILSDFGFWLWVVLDQILAVYILMWVCV